MKIVVTHLSPDMDAIGSVWVIKKFLPGWSDAKVEFVPAGLRLERVKNHPEFVKESVLKVGDDEIMHVDTGHGPLDHHQTSSMETCGAKRSWEFVLSELEKTGQQLRIEHQEAVSRIVEQIVAMDHFQEVHRVDASADYQDFSLWALNEGLQYLKPEENDYYVEFGRTCLDYLFSFFENKIWAENELVKGQEFETRYGKAIGVESRNDSVAKLAQKKGYVVVVRKDPRRGNVAIKAIPNKAKGEEQTPIQSGQMVKELEQQANGGGRRANGLEQRVEDKGEGAKISGIDLTLAYEQMKKMDPDATWFLHVGKKMLLNGSVKNPDMVPTKLTLDAIVNVLERLYK